MRIDKLFYAISRHFRRTLTVVECYRNYQLGGQATVLGNGKVAGCKMED